MATKRVSFKVACEHREHSFGSNVTKCGDCSRYVCDACATDHVATQQHIKWLRPCECTLHNKLDAAYGNLCHCGMYICEACLDIHLLKAKFHQKKYKLFK